MPKGKLVKTTNESILSQGTDNGWLKKWKVKARRLFYYWSISKSKNSERMLFKGK